VPALESKAALGGMAASGAKRTLAEIVMCARQAGNDSLIKPQ
jgi:hypothetical protein